MGPKLEARMSQAPGHLNPMQPQLFQIRRVRKETRDTFTLALQPTSGTAPFCFLPGQFNMLYAFGVGEVPISISGNPADPQTLVHTIRAVGTVTRSIQQLKPGGILGVRGPFGTHWPVVEATGYDMVIVVGGLGLAPLRPAIYHILAQRHTYGNFELIVGARTPGDLLYYQELEKWRGRFDFRVHVTVDSAGPEWRNNVGVVTTLIPRARFDPLHTVALICGPGVMMRFTIKELLERGVKPENIYLSMERNMQCGIGLCGHCQLGPYFICKDGPVFSYQRIQKWFELREI
ncbi:MAG: FAD/NAD(P)-binding protein [Deltaproteobacteria bacterium]|nr:FAD/NAD(P)-binding protein [Deltaproteobacteria bacterium]MBW1951760.1 FAD/NAD(P)-binding protein [Deltaproteobacteria bacterium]MBW1986844.1 FAD/NAD(P)-binding protein [Deltaproteobacteria bacterium]MBW2134968.1 FAD/NAD(P)-binding protein [Deltaproteobacteria bacterium]